MGYIGVMTILEVKIYLLGDLEQVVKSDGARPHRIRGVLDHGLLR